MTPAFEIGNPMEWRIFVVYGLQKHQHLDIQFKTFD
jgi:hypothetical protein